MAEFALWLDRANDGDGFFFGFNTGEKDGSNNLVFRGRLWANTPKNDQNQVQWVVNRVFYPEVGSKAAQNGGKVALLWAFQSDGTAYPGAQGAWLDNLNVERYDKPVPNVSCQSIDPITTTVATPGHTPVSKGLNLPPYVDDTLDGTMKRLQNSGVQWVRLELIASPTAFSNSNVALTSTSDRYNHMDLKYYDDLIDILCAHNIGVLGLVDNQTLLDQSWKANGLVSDDYKTAFTEITSQLVRYYDDRIRYWEVWNEPDNEDRRLKDDEYPKLLIATYDKIKATNPDDQVVFGGLGGADPNAATHLANIYTTLTTLHRTRPAPFDIFAIHPYPSIQYTVRKTVLTDPQLYMIQDEGNGPTILHKFMKQMKDNGDVNKPIWITEVGWNRAGDINGSAATKACGAVNQTLVTGVEQATDLSVGFDILFKSTYWDWKPDSPHNVASVRKIFWYQYQDTAVPVNCKQAVASVVSPSWYDSYARRFVFPSANDTLVDWWFGLYSGIDRVHGKTEPEPNPMVECLYRLYPNPDAFRTCLNLTQGAYLPLIQTAGVATSGQ